jgi:hypothetical protein
MRTPFAIMAGFLFLAGTATAQPKAVPAPRALPPMLRVVTNVHKDDGRIAFAVTEVKSLKSTKSVRELVDGVFVTRIFPEETPYVERSIHGLTIGVHTVIAPDGTKTTTVGFRVVTPDGKAVSAQDALKRLKEDSVIAISADSEIPDPAFLRALSPDTLVLIPPAPKSKEPAPPKK